MTDLLLNALATWRLSRLVTQDEITAEAREWAIDLTLKRHWSKVRYLLTCSHCASMWAASAVLALRVCGRPGRALRDALAVAGGASVLIDLLDP